MTLVHGSFRPLPVHRFSGSSHRTIMKVDEAPTVSLRSGLPSFRLDRLETSLHEDPWDPALGAVGLSSDPGISFRHSGWELRRRCVVQALAGIEDAENRLARFRNCGNHAWVLESDNEPGTYRVSCDKCKDRFCDPCAAERARHIAACVAEFAHDRTIRLITLTLRKSKRTLKQDVDRLYAAFVKLRRRATWKATQAGGMYFVEIKRRRGDDGWHTHLHVLSEGAWLSKSWLSHAWNELTGDSYIVDIRLCDSGERAAQYVAKYAGKGVHGSCYHEPEVLREAMLAIKGRRLVGKWGSWGDLDLDHETPEGDWHGVDTLARLIDRSHRGELQAAQILQALIGAEPCTTSQPGHPARGP